MLKMVTKTDLRCIIIGNHVGPFTLNSKLPWYDKKPATTELPLPCYDKKQATTELPLWPDLPWQETGYNWTTLLLWQQFSYITAEVSKRLDAEMPYRDNKSAKAGLPLRNRTSNRISDHCIANKFATPEMSDR